MRGNGRGDLTHIAEVGVMPPWDAALLDEVRRLEAALADGRVKYAALLIENRKLRRSLYDSRQRLARWKHRQESWRREREQLERGLDGY